MPNINTKICDLCGTCVGVCPSAALLLGLEELTVDESRCTNCDICVSICPVAALSPKKKSV